jgi:hypothetical protein
MLKLSGRLELALAQVSSLACVIDNIPTVHCAPVNGFHAALY